MKSTHMIRLFLRKYYILVQYNLFSFFPLASSSYAYRDELRYQKRRQPSLSQLLLQSSTGEPVQACPPEHLLRRLEDGPRSQVLVEHHELPHGSLPEEKVRIRKRKIGPNKA